MVDKFCTFARRYIVSLVCSGLPADDRINLINLPELKKKGKCYPAIPLKFESPARCLLAPTEAQHLVWCSILWVGNELDIYQVKALKEKPSSTWLKTPSHLCQGVCLHDECRAIKTGSDCPISFRFQSADETPPISYLLERSNIFLAEQFAI